MVDNATKIAIVEKGDYIIFNPDSKGKITIKWQQNMVTMHEKYLALPYSVKDKEASGSLFIQLAFVDSFFEKCSEDESSNPLFKGGYKIQVDEAFQYGQNNEKTLRFLVYHNKANKPYKHRFIQSHAFQNIANKIVAIGGAGSGIWGEAIKQGSELGQAFIGDYLRDF